MARVGRTAERICPPPVPAQHDTIGRSFEHATERPCRDALTGFSKFLQDVYCNTHGVFTGAQADRRSEPQLPFAPGVENDAGRQKWSTVDTPRRRVAAIRVFSS